MSERIEVGDLVMVVRGHSHCVEKFGGIPMTVRAIHPASVAFTCHVCGPFAPIYSPQAWAQIGEGWLSFPLMMLKRFPPLSEPETTETREGVEA